MRDDAPRTSAADTAAREMLWLLGQPQLSDYLDFVKAEVVGGEAISPRQLADEWRAANDRYYELEQEEAGIADAIERLPLDPGLAPLVEALMASPHYRNTFDTLPMSVEMVELDRLVVSQPFIAGGFSAERARALGSQPSPEALFRYCLPVERDLPAVTVERNARGDYRISSFSTDLRHHEPRLLTPAETSSLTSHGPIAAVIGVIVGFGSNFLTAISSDTRLLLHNGYHRAYSLRALGFTHAPCLIETVTRKDELRLAAAEPVAADPAFYFRAGRPPLLKDYFDPLLTRRFPVRPKRMVVDVEIKIRKTDSVETPPLAD
ncbi:MAG TPA: hypothetical protein VF702_08320 [Allosphingosinicella sp.]|jgi:hypothetical protein